MPANCIKRLVCTSAVLLLWCWPALAQPPRGRAACEIVYKNALKLEKKAQLVEAHRKAASCARPECGPFLEQQCSVLADRIEGDLPSVVPVVTDEDGEPVVDVSVSMDGQPLCSQIDGHALSIDPGVHQFSFQKNGDVVAERKLIIAQGQRNRAIRVKLKAKPADEQVSATAESEHKLSKAISSADDDAIPEQKGHSYLPSLVLLGSGAAAITSWALLTYWGNQDNDQLSQCSPNCPQSSLDHIRHLYLGADISLGVGIPALLTGAWLAWRNYSAISSSRYALDVAPTASGVFASVRGAF